MTLSVLCWVLCWVLLDKKWYPDIHVQVCEHVLCLCAVCIAIALVFCAKGGTTLNQLPIGLHVKILNFNGRFEAYWATFGMLSWYQLIQNRWKFNICFNVWVVVGIVLRYGHVNSALPVFDPISSLKTQYHPLRIIRDYFHHQNSILFFCVFKFICSPYIIISYITSHYLLFYSPKRCQNI